MMKILQFYTIVLNELKLQLRNIPSLVIVLAMPPALLFLVPTAFDFSIKNIRCGVVSSDSDPIANQIGAAIQASPYISKVNYYLDAEPAIREMEYGRLDLYVTLQKDFTRELESAGHRPVIYIVTDAINTLRADAGVSYVQQIIKQSFKENIALSYWDSSMANNLETSFRFNPGLSNKLFLLPGLLAFLVTIVCGYTSALSFVREKQNKMLPSLKMTQLSPWIYIWGKISVSWAIGMLTLFIGVLISKYFYHVIPVGSGLLLFGYLSFYTLTVVSLGMTIGAICRTEYEAMFCTFCLMLAFILTSGLFLAIPRKSLLMDVIAFLNPVTACIQVMRRIVLKGTGFTYLLPVFLNTVLLGFGFLFIGGRLIFGELKKPL